MSLGAVLIDAMRLWEQQKAGGVSHSDRLRGLDGVLRQAWPFVREWKFLCNQCRDYGFVLSECDGSDQCGRHRAHLPHTFGVPCFCEQGKRYRAKPKPGPEDFTEAGKSKGFTKVGR